jgi:hypothetical protein
MTYPEDADRDVADLRAELTRRRAELESTRKDYPESVRVIEITERRIKKLSALISDREAADAEHG